eukprot:3735751-Pyramimonas_sp.AAC.1
MAVWPPPHSRPQGRLHCGVRGPNPKLAAVFDKATNKVFTAAQPVSSFQFPVFVEDLKRHGLRLTNYDLWVKWGCCTVWVHNGPCVGAVVWVCGDGCRTGAVPWVYWSCKSMGACDVCTGRAVAPAATFLQKGSS